MGEAEVVGVVGGNLKGQLVGWQRFAPTGGDFLPHDVGARGQIGEVKDAIGIGVDALEITIGQT